MEQPTWIPTEITLLSVRRALHALQLFKHRGDIVYASEVRSQYRVIARSCHPDKTLNNNCDTFQSINAAYTMLNSLFDESVCICFDHPPRKLLMDDFNEHKRSLYVAITDPETVHILYDLVRTVYNKMYTPENRQG